MVPLRLNPSTTDHSHTFPGGGEIGWIGSHLSDTLDHSFFFPGYNIDNGKSRFDEIG